MADKTWTGGIYLREEGGYEIILRALAHYKKRLMKIDKSPELRDSAAMFSGILRQAAMKTIPVIDETVRKIESNLINPQESNQLSQDVAIIQKALISYETDLQKAQDTGNEYYVSLIGDLSKVKGDSELIKTAKAKINQFIA